MTEPITKERMEAARCFFGEQLNDRLAQDQKLAAQDEPGAIAHPIYMGKLVEPYYRTVLALLDEKVKQIKAGVGPGIFPGVGQNPTLGGPSPGLSAEDERALENLEDWIGALKHEGYPITETDKETLAHLRSRLAKPAPSPGPPDIKPQANNAPLSGPSEEERREMLHTLDLLAEEWYSSSGLYGESPDLEANETMKPCVEAIRTLIDAPPKVVTRGAFDSACEKFAGHWAGTLDDIKGLGKSILEELGVEVEGEKP